MAEKLPYMPVWVYDIETDEDCMMLCAAGFGVYMRLLFRQWIEGSLPESVETMARLIRETEETVRLTPGFINSKFPVCSDGRRRNERCAIEREKALSKVQTNRVNGRKGGRPPNLGGNPTVNRPKTQGVTQKEPNSSIRAYGSESNSESLLLDLERDGLRIPNKLNAHDFREWYTQWLEHSADQGTRNTMTTANLTIARLTKMGPIKAVEAIKYSIAQGYKGIHEPNGKGPADEPGRSRKREGEYDGIGTDPDAK